MKNIAIYFLSVLIILALSFKIVSINKSNNLLIEKNRTLIATHEKTLYNYDISELDKLIKYHEESYFDFSIIFKLDSIEGVKHVKNRMRFHSTRVNRLYNNKAKLIWNYYKNNKIK